MLRRLRAACAFGGALLAGRSCHAHAMPPRRDLPPGASAPDGASQRQADQAGCSAEGAASSNPLVQEPVAPDAFERANSSLEALRSRSLAGAFRVDLIAPPPLGSACRHWMPFRLVADQALAQSNAWSSVWPDADMQAWTASFNAERAALMPTVPNTATAATAV